jgi:uncharacterized protein (TIRG00374 family)
MEVRTIPASGTWKHMRSYAPARRLASVATAALAVVLLVRLPAMAGTTWAGVPLALEQIPIIVVAALAALWLAGLTCSSMVLTGGLPGLSTARALTLSLSGSAVANVLPLGGAAGVSLNFAMTRRWGFSAKSFAAYTLVTNVCDVATKLVVVAAASLVLLAAGDTAVLSHDPIAVLVVLVLVPVLGSLLFCQPGAVAIGRAADRAVFAASGLIRRPLHFNLRVRLPDLSKTTVGLVKRRWRRLTVGSVSYAALQVALLWAAMHAAGLDLNATLLAAAYGVERLLSLVPLTPGGVGVVEAGMASVLTALGAAPDQAIAGILLYRGFTYLAEIPVGGAVLLIWSFRQGLSKPPVTPAGSKAAG